MMTCNWMYASQFCFLVYAMCFILPHNTFKYLSIISLFLGIVFHRFACVSEDNLRENIAKMEAKLRKIEEERVKNGLDQQ